MADREMTARERVQRCMWTARTLRGLPADLSRKLIAKPDGDSWISHCIVGRCEGCERYWFCGAEERSSRELAEKMGSILARMKTCR